MTIMRMTKIILQAYRVTLYMYNEFYDIFLSTFVIESTDPHSIVSLYQKIGWRP